MNKQLVEWQQKIDGLSQRERLLVLAMAVGLVVMLLQWMLLDPILAQRSAATKQTKTLQQQSQQQQNQIEILKAEIQVGVNRKKEKNRDSLKQQVEQLDQKIDASVVAMIPPQLMTQVLESVLTQDLGLKLLSLENIAVTPIIEQDSATVTEDVMAETAASAPRQGLFKHGFVLRLQGGYMAAISYFDSLSQLPWLFYWDSLHYEVTEYPNATITLEVHTVSMSEDWIGV